MRADRQVLEAIEREWQGLVEVADAQVAAWSREIPALWGVEHLDDVALCCVGDAACLALAQRARRGDVLAARVILQAMLEPLSAAPLPHWITLAEAVTIAWLRVMDTPLGDPAAAGTTDAAEERDQPASRDVLTALVRATVRSLWRDPQHGSRARLIPIPVREDDCSAGWECARVLTQALRFGLLTPADAVTLHDVYIEGAAADDVACAHHVSRRAIRRRCDASLSTLRQHTDLLAAA